jgi:hypothetical protein
MVRLMAFLSVWGVLGARGKFSQTYQKNWLGYNYKNGGGSTSLKKALASREKEVWGLTVLR